ncbi:MAG: type II toxin-antitoxin system RelE/ParE family toxin [Immundisolibacter sp.]|uniref:type II toxin-antitoxin system RelE/ParE family toxin n=1 Tax=Immundisolibacter sp. TaxID=1934948 RepID=UPI003D0D5DE5
MRIVWQDHAKIELRDAVQYYRANAGDHVAHDFRNEVQHTARQLLEHPEIGVRLHQKLRRYALHGYPFNLVYRLTPETIIIVALAHQSRRPGYWADRR